MEKINSSKLSEWPFKDFHHISDLIDFEGPILVHCMDDKNYHALYYWVEGNENFNRWLCFNISIIELYNYLNKTISLYDLILSKEQDFFCTTDIDKNLNYTNYQLLYGYAIPDKYLPKVNSYLIIEPEYDYDNLLFRLFPDKLFNQHLKKNKSFDLVLNRNNDEFYDVVEAQASAELINNLCDSYSAYVGVKFYKKHKNDFTDPNEMNRVAKQIVKSLPLLLPMVSSNSFHISLATSEAMRTEKIPAKYEEFRRTITEEYQREVLDIDLNNESDIKELVDNFDDQSRKRIFDPIIKAINKSHYNLTYINKSENYHKSYSKITPLNKETLIPKIPKPAEEPELEKMLLTITYEVEASDYSTLSKRQLKEKEIYKTLSKNAILELEKLVTDEFTLYFSEPILYNFKIIPFGYELTFAPLGIIVSDASKDNTFTKFIDAFVEITKADYLSKEPTNRNNKKYLENIIKNVDSNKL